MKKVWDVVRFGVIQSTPPTAPRRPAVIRKILARLVSAQAQCWLLLDGQGAICAMAVTQVITDEMTGTKYLTIHNFYGYRVTPPPGWGVLKQALAEFARGQGCHCLAGVTQNKRLADLVVSQGGRASSLVTVEV